MSENDFWRSDIGRSFSKLIESMFIEINGERVEKLINGRFRWKNFEGTYPEVAARIRSENVAAKNALQESIQKGKELLKDPKS